MKKYVLYAVMAFLVVVLIALSGCVGNEKRSPGEVGKSQATSQPAEAPASQVPDHNAGQQQKGFSDPTFAMIGFVTYQKYSMMYTGPEYSIDLLIQSATNHPVTFNKIVAKYYDQGPLKTIESNLGRSVTLSYGEAVRPNIQTAFLQEMQDRVESAGKKTIVIYIQLKNGDENVGGEYSAALPQVSYMETQGSSIRQIDFALDNMPLYKNPIP